MVVDCARADDFPGGAKSVRLGPNFSRLLSESTVFTQAVSPSTWTLPAHASLFTGEYPWVHNVHGLRSLKLDSGVETLGACLQRSGYATAFFSGNRLLGPEYGLTSGFQYAAWASPWESYFRFKDAKTVPHSLTTGATRPSGRTGPLWGALETSTLYGSRFLLRYPRSIGYFSRLGRRVRFPDASLDTRASPWIEPALGRWLVSLAPQRPFFAFINYMDCHEPYVHHSPWAGETASEWTRQDPLGWTSGQWHESESNLEPLHAVYRQNIESLDSRLGDILQVLEETHRLSDTAIVICGDHGQAFGEHGELFHGSGLSSEVARVPLWIRPPTGQPPIPISGDWVSLTQVTHLLGGILFGDSEPRWMTEMAPFRPPSSAGNPVLCLSEGTVWKSTLKWLPRSRHEQLSHLQLAAYYNDLKIVFDASAGTLYKYDLGADSGEDHPGSLGSSEPEIRCKTALRGAVDLLHRGTLREDGAVAERLRGWGYA